jgi:uncharacterized membrane protein YqjE
MPSRSPKKLKTGRSPVSASPEVKRRLSRLVYFGLTLSLVSLVLILLPIESEPWLSARLVFLGAGTVILVVWATRFSLWQRHEYWRERGEDPKHHERLPDHPSE